MSFLNLFNCNNLSIGWPQHRELECQLFQTENTGNLGAAQGKLWQYKGKF